MAVQFSQTSSVDKQNKTFNLSYCDIHLDSGKKIFYGEPIVLIQNIYNNKSQIIIPYHINFAVKEIVAEKRKAEWEADRPNRERREAEKKAEDERIAAERRAKYEREEAEKESKIKQNQISQNDITISQDSNNPTVQQPQASSYSLSPSFDCSKASTPAEKLICSNRELAEADVNLSQIYKNALNIAADKTLLKKNQNEWLKNERNKCSDVPCMLQTYKNRINQLSSN